MTQRSLCLALLFLSAPAAVHAHGKGGPSKDDSSRMERTGYRGQHQGEAYGRGLHTPAAAGHAAKYGGASAPINSSHDMRYIQNSFARAMGFPGATDNNVMITPPAGTKFFSADPGGGVVLAAPAGGKAPWEVGVTRALVDVDLGLNPKDPYASRVAGIQDAYKGDYEKALPMLKTAIANGQADATALSFGALAAFHRGDMKNAADWAKESLSKDAAGPWAKLADSVEHLTEDRVGSRMKLPKPKPEQTARGTDPTPGAVGQRLFPNQVASDEPLKGTAGLLQDARAAFAVRDFPRVEKVASTVLFQDAANSEALRLRAAAGNRLGHYAAALEDAERGLALEPASSAFLESKALAAGQLGDYGSARAAALAMLAANPKNAAALRLLAFAEAGLGNLDAMQRALEHAAAFDPASAELLRRLRGLPPGADPSGLFTDELLFGELAGGAGPALKESGRGGLAKALLALGAAALAGLLVGGAAIAVNRRRARAPAQQGLDLSVFQVAAARAAPAGDSGEPTQVGPYRVLSKIGTGGMGVVYKAEDSKLGRRVALKRLRSEIAQDPREHERFLREARIVCTLDHPGIVRIHSVQESPEGDYLVFEFVEGTTLAQTLAICGKLTPREAASLIGQAAEAVAYAHAQGVVHRDLKPSNLMLDTKGRVRVMDFGVARAAADALQRLSGSQTAPGTPSYTAPEQAEGVTSPACDVYALGVCLYEMLAGRPPFEGTAGAMHLAKRALEPDPAKRFASPRELAAALGAATV
ncbi:MAG: protein kinase [Elusimicrobia bacterium]|nr:protein kinase [Elusimicrobiota bacterium]